MSTAVVRVKRKRTDDPLDALVLSFKKTRPNDCVTTTDTATTSSEILEATDLSTQVFRLTGTSEVSADDDAGNADARRHLQEIFSNKKLTETTSSPTTVFDHRFEKIHMADVRVKCQREKKAAVHRQRDDLLLALRSIDLPMLENSEKPVLHSTFTENFDGLFEGVTAADRHSNENRENSPATTSNFTCNGQAMVRVNLDGMKTSENQQKVDEYVYDYYVPSQLLDDGKSERYDAYSKGEKFPSADVMDYFNNLIAVYPYDPGFMNENGNGNGENEGVNFDEDNDDDDEDSNAETNWRNDYPDEDEDFENRYDYYDQNYECKSENEENDEGDSHFSSCIQRLNLGPDESGTLDSENDD